MDVKMPLAWKELLAPEFEMPYFRRVTEFAREEYRAAANRTGPPVYPAAKNIFRAFDKCDLDELKVVIIGQDPYHGPGQANGLCFSVNEGVPMPPSLKNIFKEIQDELGTPFPRNGNLDRWAEQGVLLMNAVLTVRESTPGSHGGQGWEDFTSGVVRALNETKEEVVYLLWGAYAQKKGQIVDASRNCVLKSAHPSPLSAHNGFFGNGHFAKANEYLKSVGKVPIVW